MDKGGDEEGMDKWKGRRGMKLSMLLDDGGRKGRTEGGRFRRC